MKIKPIGEALRYAARHPEPDEAPIDTPAWKFISRNLFDIANSADPRVRGSLTRANKAQRMILNRMEGTRRTGTAPAVAAEATIAFINLATHEAIEAGMQEETDDR